MAFVSLEELGGIICSLLEDATLLEDAGALEELAGVLLDEATLLLDTTGGCSLSFGTCPLNPS